MPTTILSGEEAVRAARLILPRLSAAGRAQSDVRAAVGLLLAAHEEVERQALEGELARLEADWREAEEIAAIADDMFVPESIQRFIDERRAKV